MHLVFGASWRVFESRLEVKLIIHTAQIEHFSTVIPGQKITNHGGTYAYDHNHGFLCLFSFCNFCTRKGVCSIYINKVLSDLHWKICLWSFQDIMVTHVDFGLLRIYRWTEIHVHFPLLINIGILKWKQLTYLSPQSKTLLTGNLISLSQVDR